MAFYVKSYVLLCVYVVNEDVSSRHLRWPFVPFALVLSRTIELITISVLFLHSSLVCFVHPSCSPLAGLRDTRSVFQLSRDVVGLLLRSKENFAFRFRCGIRIYMLLLRSKETFVTIVFYRHVAPNGARRSIDILCYRHVAATRQRKLFTGMVAQ